MSKQFLISTYNPDLTKIHELIKKNNLNESIINYGYDKFFSKITSIDCSDENALLLSNLINENSNQFDKTTVKLFEL